MSKDIQDYGKKRDFSKTPEPRPKTRRRNAADPVFVVHRHEARRLHYDLRLEVNGVLKSFAVPKGFSFHPNDKHLAVRTEDHPLEYEHFDGVIPAGQYGAGTMTIWDRGPYELLNGPWDAAIAAGKIELKMRGGFLRGEWHMVKLKKEKDQWLLFKSRDYYAREKDESPVSLDLVNALRTDMPQRVSRMKIGNRSTLFVDPEWIYEPLLPGLRVLADKRDGDVRFRGTQSGIAQHAPRVVAALEKLKASNAIVDGVLICLDAANRPCPIALDKTLAGQAQQPIFYYAFDLLYYDEWDVRGFPLAERKAALASILPKHAAVLYVDHERNRAAELFETVEQVGLRGLVAKSATSTYRRGERDDWLWIPAETTPRRPQGPNRRRKEGAKSRSIAFTNRSKVLWPRAGYTKGDLIDYYEQIADWILPYLMDRPLSLNRFPNGIDRTSFFQKNTPEQAPSWLKTIVIESEHRDEVENRFIVCNDRSTLLYLANQAAIELHPWSSRCGTLDSPDWAIIDLDPTTDDFRRVVRVARGVEALLYDVGLRGYLKTSGAKGLHIYVPVVAGYSYDQVRMFSEGFARLIALRHPDVATVERSKPRRDGKVYVDFLQNRRGQTIVAPYVVRPVPHATVSTPLEWDELDDELHPGRFTLSNLTARVAEVGDLFQSALTDRQNFGEAIDRLRELVP